MSTRCNVRFKGWKEEVQLYRHCDGYPTSILPDLAEAFHKAGGDWETGRAGKSARYLIKYSSGCYEPESHTTAHGDIAYLYTVECRGDSHVGALCEWWVKVECPVYTKNYSIKGWETILDFTEVTEAAKLAEGLEG